jgi:hypothetical protein
MILNATVLTVLGHLAAIRRDDAGASELLDEGRALVREVRDGDLTGYDRLQQLLTVAFVDSFPRPGPAQPGRQATTSLRGCSPTAWP